MHKMSTSTTSSPSPPPPPRRSIPPLVLLSFAVLHSQVYWLYSIIYHLCNNLSDRPIDLSLDDTVLKALTRRSGRPRALSEPPQQTSCDILQQYQILSSHRPRSTTISATTVDADVPLQRQQWVQKIHACVDEQQQQLDDERLGRTRPPRWWQRTRQHLIRLDDVESMKFINNDHMTTTILPQRMQCDGHHDVNNNINDLLVHHSTTTTRRPLTKIRSILTKSQIEPENLKRKTILGIRWSGRSPIRIKDTTTPSTSKRRLFSSLPAWKQKSVG